MIPLLVILVITCSCLGIWLGATSTGTWRRFLGAGLLVLLANALLSGASHLVSFEASFLFVAVWLYMFLPATLGFCIGVALGLIGRWLTRKERNE